VSELNEHHRAPLHCTNCRQTVVVTIDRHVTGNLTIKCPMCGHEHYRYCRNGIITEDRWRSSASMVSVSYYHVSTASSTDSYYSTVGGFLSEAWHNTDGTANY